MSTPAPDEFGFPIPAGGRGARKATNLPSESDIIGLRK
jgi:hypothetical protein